MLQSVQAYECDPIFQQRPTATSTSLE